MIGYEVEYLPETVVAKRRDHLIKGGPVTELRVELAMVDDVIAVRASGTRFQIGRGINVADAQPRQIGRERRRVPKTKFLMEWQAVSRPGDWRGTGFRHFRWSGRCRCQRYRRTSGPSRDRNSRPDRPRPPARTHGRTLTEI